MMTYMRAPLGLTKLTESTHKIAANGLRAILGLLRQMFKLSADRVQMLKANL